MRVGLHVGYWGLGLEANEQLALVREAEELGFDSVWAAEAYGSDAATVLSWLASQTERLGRGFGGSLHGRFSEVEEYDASPSRGREGGALSPGSRLRLPTRSGSRAS